MATPLEESVLEMSVLPVGVEPVAYTKAVRAAALPWNQRRERRRRIEERARSPRRLLEHEPLFTVAVSSAPRKKIARVALLSILRAHGERGRLKASESPLRLLDQLVAKRLAKGIDAFSRPFRLLKLGFACISEPPFSN